MNDNNIDLDGDPRPADQQAADFFNRPGHYHQVRIEVPEATNAECVIKVTDEQLPLAVEILRQIRGALFARITLTKLIDTQFAREAVTEIPDGPPYIIGEHFTLGPRYDGARKQAAPRVTFWDKDFNAVDAPSKYTVVDAHDDRTINTCEPCAEDIARANKVPVEWVKRVPSATGDTAWTITPPAPPASGRHARPEPIDARLTTADIHRLRRERFKHSLMRTTIHTVAPTEYQCVCGETITDTTEDEASAAWDLHRSAITARTWHPGDHIDEIHDAAYGDDDQ